MLRKEKKIFNNINRFRNLGKINTIDFINY